MFAFLFVASDPVDDLIARIRHPYRWALRHPLRALGWTVRGRFQ
jgi:hypothetical protein